MDYYKHVIAKHRNYKHVKWNVKYESNICSHNSAELNFLVVILSFSNFAGPALSVATDKIGHFSPLNWLPKASLHIILSYKLKCYM